MCNDCSIKPGRLALESGRTSPRPVPLSAPRPFLSRPRVEGSTDSELEPPQPVDNASEGLSDPKMPVLRLRGEEIEVSERALGYEMVRLSTTPRFDLEIRQGLASRHLPRSRWHGRGRRRPSGALVSEPAREMPLIGMFITRIRAPPYLRRRVRHRCVSQTPATYGGPIPVLQGSGDALLGCQQTGRGGLAGRAR